MNKSKVHEKFLCEIWKDQNFNKNLITKDNQKVIVIDAGIHNLDEGGPDFNNARIKIGNLTYVGDVEIDSFYSDWKNHGHSLNKKYNKVILHITFNNDSNKGFVTTQNGRKVSTISFKNLLDDNLRDKIQNAIQSERKFRIDKMPCLEVCKDLEDKVKLDFLFELGIARFKKKCEKMLDRLKEITYLDELSLKEPVVQYQLDDDFHNRKFSHEDFKKAELWEQLIYESIFEALGYSKNKDIMYRLAKMADINLIKRYKGNKNFVEIIESALFHISGLFNKMDQYPDEETSEYARNLTEHWNEIKQIYDGELLNESQWHFFRLRPNNFPTIRIAGGVRILDKIFNQNMIGNIIANIQNINNFRFLANELRSFLIVRGNGFWHKHYVFDKQSKVEIKYFIGLNRADEIIINVLLPIIAIYFDIFGKQHLSKKLIKLYVSYYQRSENNLVLEVSDSLGLHDAWKRSVLSQGMIELFRNFCLKDKCLDCRLGKEVFED